jgi:heat shock transcription factor
MYANQNQVEELFETSPSDSTQVKQEPTQPVMQGMMNLIHNTNAQARPNSGGMEFPEMLSHYENANGNSPLTSEQRNTMLNLIANSSSTSGSNNALVSPVPPQPPSLAELGYTSQELEDLIRLQAEQEARIDNVKNALTPLSPSGSIPGLDAAGNYFPSDGVSESNSNLDLDQYLDPGAFFNTSSPIDHHADYGYDGFGNTSMGDSSHFDLGMDGTGTGVGMGDDGSGDFKGRIVETGSSEAETPEEIHMKFEDGGLGAVASALGGGGDVRMGVKSPSKRRKKN